MTYYQYLGKRVKVSLKDGSEVVGFLRCIEDAAENSYGDEDDYPSDKLTIDVGEKRWMFGLWAHEIESMDAAVEEDEIANVFVT